MIPRKLIKGFDEARLKWFLVGFFLLLAVPTSVLIWLTHYSRWYIPSPLRAATTSYPYN